MAETIQQREESMRRVLRYIQEQKPFEDLSFVDQRILKECYDLGYFEGIVLLEMISGNIVAEYRHDPRLTYKGLQFLDLNKTSPVSGLGEIASELKSMNENVSQNHAEKKAEKEKDRRFQLLNTLVGAAAGAALTLLIEHFDHVVRFVWNLFH